MKIAIPITNNKISSHFGLSEAFMIYELNNENKVVNSKSILNGGIKGREIADLMKDYNVEIMIIKEIGENAKINLEKAGIKVLYTLLENKEEVIEAYINNKIT